MIETHLSKDFVYLCILHNSYIGLKDSEDSLTFEPISILWNPKNELFELSVDVISNQQINDNESETYGSTGFFRITPRVS